VLYELLANTAKNRPRQTAVICGEKQFSYRQFKHRVDRLAGGIRSLGLAKGRHIAVILPNCHRYLEIYFAAAKLGAVLVPINTRLDQKDYSYILENSQADAVIFHSEYFPGLKERRNEFAGPRIMVGTASNAPGTDQEDIFDYESLPDVSDIPDSSGHEIEESDIAQIYYTSGTTGKPKGVILTHRNNHIHSEHVIKELSLSSDDRWLHVSPMFHLADAWAVWAITEVGGTHILVPRFEPGRVLESIEKNKVTLSNFIPTMLNRLVNFQGVENYDFSSLRLIMSGGAPIATDIIRKVLKIFGCRYIQTFGLTETSPFLTMSILDGRLNRLPFEEKLKYMATTGRPFYGVELKVVREDGTEVLPNETEVGEIIARGDTVTPGYWRRPEETAERIVDGWLHTRDLAVVNPEGYITIVDRKDDIIITGGENVYSIEVEDVLYSHPGIMEAAVIGVPDADWGERVTAVAVRKEGDRPEEAEVIKHCRDRMAGFKIPKKVIFMDRLPKTGSGKICKFKLRQILSSLSEP
jgi:fatty-acyl-CoA synthase